MKSEIRTMFVVCCVTLTLLFPGCNLYMQRKYGITKPKEETPESLLRFLERQHFPADHQFLFKDSSSYRQALLNRDFRQFLLSHLIFDRQGVLLGRDTTQCQWGGYERIRDLSPDSVYDKSAALTLDWIQKKIRSLRDETAREGTGLEPDFTVVVVWAKFLGQYNYRLFNLDEAVKQNRTAKLRLIWLNADMQECWRLSPGQRINIR